MVLLCSSNCVFFLYLVLDINNEGSDMKEAVDLIQSDLVIRHRRAAAAVAAAAEKKPSPYSPPNSNIQVPENKNTTSDVTEEMVFVQASHKVAETYAEEANQGDTYTVAKMVMKDNVDCHQGVTDDVVEDVIEAAHGNDSCLKEPEPINEEKVSSNLSLCEFISKLLLVFEAEMLFQRHGQTLNPVVFF